ncbi:MAG: hypothetical protein ABI131_12315 [Nostocoides sp.]
MSSTRGPVFSRFIATGGFVGAVLGALAAAFTRTAPDYGTFAAYGYFAIAGIVLGGLLGAVLAIALDRPTRE